jgi:tetratricopeptide (TPR) repeat protein
MTRRTRWLSALAAVGVLGLVQPALGQDSDELARKHFESGVAYLQESDYENALRAFEKSYELSKRPEILLNIATVNERQNDLKGAIAALEKFLATAPESDQRQTTEARLANLKKRVESEPPTEATTPPPTTTAPPTTSPPPQVETATPPPEQKSNIPAYVLLGLGAVTAGGAVLTGILAKGEYDDAKDTCSPNCQDSDLQSGRTLALTSTILTGVAVVSASVGAVLLFTNKPSTQDAHRAKRRSAYVPRVFLGVDTKSAVGSAGWAF